MNKLLSLLPGLNLVSIILSIAGIIFLYFIYGAALYTAGRMILNRRPSFKRSLVASFITFLLCIVTSAIMAFLASCHIFSNPTMVIILYIVEGIISAVLQIAIPVAVIKYTFDIEDRLGWAISIYIVGIFLSFLADVLIVVTISLFIGGLSTMLISFFAPLLSR